MHTPTPDGTADWNQWTLATLGYAGGTGTLSYTQCEIAAHWHTGKPLATLEAADINGDGVPDLWAVTPAGVAQAYLISHLSTSGTARIKAGKRQHLP